MKILFIIDSLRMGGKERRLIELLKGLATKKEIKSQLVVLSDDVFYTYFEKLNITTHYLLRKGSLDFSILKKLFEICKLFQPDIIHSWESMCSVYAVPIAKMSGVKFVNGMITNAPFNVNQFGRGGIRATLTFPFSDVVISNSFAGLKSYKAPMHKSVCIHNGFDFSRIRELEHHETVKKRFNLNAQKIVGMLASFSPKKDFENYVLAALRICSKRKGLVFIAIGDGSTLNKCMAIVKPEFRDKMRFIGKHKNVESLVNIIDIGVLLTNHKIHGEGISNSVLEYMALEKPVVATNGGGTGEIVSHGKTGFLVKPFNVDDITRRIEFLLDNDAVAKKMGRAGKQRLIREFGIGKMTNAYINLYRKCIIRP